MSSITDILDRLSGITALRERVIVLTEQIQQTQSIVIDQQRELAELKGQLKALIAIQSKSLRN